MVAGDVADSIGACGLPDRLRASEAMDELPRRTTKGDGGGDTDVNAFPSESLSVSMLYIRRALLMALVVVGLANSTGCLCSRVQWREPAYPPPLEARRIPRSGHHAKAERLYAKALNYEERCRASCVDLYFEAARLTAYASRKPCFCRDRILHEAALMKMVDAGQRFKRFKASSGLTICRKGQRIEIPVTKHGFVWEPGDFGRLVPIGYYETAEIKQKKQIRGVGVPFVVNRINSLQRPFMRGGGAFPATLVLVEGKVGDCACSDEVPPVRLELHDPLRVDCVDVHGESFRISKDTTAPLVYQLQGEQYGYLTTFLNRSRRQREGDLYMLEPYQKGKVPIVLIHGLLSDAFTWVEMVNQLIVHPGFMDRYQIWAFDYSTGNSFLLAASDLRKQLVEARQTFDPGHTDPQMANMILVGHSMGGLVAKLQVTSSGDRLWNSIARKPLDQLKLPDYLRTELRDLFYFEPSPDVTRVVFMATPHRGSRYARGPLGCLGSKLVNMPPEETRDHDLIIRCNPGAFTDEVRDRIPTSIDLLDPKSSLLKAIEGLPATTGVCMHSVIGNACCSFLHGKSDGIVSVSSATEARAVSELTVKQTHTGVKSDPKAINEVLYILLAHLQSGEMIAPEPHIDLMPQILPMESELGEPLPDPVPNAVDISRTTIDDVPDPHL